jgi:glycosyltransferase involved in cell wall biosynthesis
MRVMYLSPTGQLGGAETSLVDILASVRRAEPAWPLHLLAASDGPMIARVRSLGVTAEVLPFPPAIARLGEHGATASGSSARFAAQILLASPAALRYRAALARAIEAFDPAIVHTNGLKMHLLGAWGCHPGRTRLVWHLHDYLGSRPTTTKLLRWHHGHPAAVITNSASVAADAARALANGTRVVTVRNGVDLDRFSTTGVRANLDAMAGLPQAPPNTVRVGLVATLARWKGHATFLEAIARLPAHLPVRAYIVGDAVYQTEGSQYSLDELRHLARSLGVADRVGFTGFVHTPEATFRALQVVVHASTAPEPFGLVIAEAMACGRAVIVSNAGGAAEIVEPGVDALVHTPGDAADLAEQITALAGNQELRARLGRAARATAERSFDRARMAAELVPIYRAAAAAGSADSGSPRLAAPERQAL